MRRVVVLSLIWGWSFLLIKVALRGMTPATVAFLRIGLGMIVMVVVLRATRIALPRDLRTWRHFAVMGLAYSALPFTLLAWGEQHITSALAAVVNATTGLFTAMAAAIGLGERLRRPQIVGLAVGISGVAVAAGVSRADLGSSSGAGILATLGVSACYGFSFVYAQRHLSTVPPLVAATGQLIAGAALALPLAVVTSLSGTFAPNGREWLAVVVLGVAGTGLAYVINYQSIAAVGSTRASMVTYLVPIVAVTAGVVFLHEAFHLRLLVGGALVIAGIALVQGRLAHFARRPPPAVALVALLVLFVGCGGGGSGGSGSDAAGPCGPETEEQLDPTSLQHLLPGAPEPAYTSDPPTSGAHRAGGALAGAQDDPVSRPAQVALLEKGGVMIQHRGATGADLRRLRTLADREVVVAPNPGLDHPVVATAWRYRMACEGAGGAALDALEEFIDAHKGKGPE
ncbi:MAG: EamA family transporter [Acidimicrobiales bacterium]